MTLASLFVLSRFVHFATVMLVFGVSIFSTLLSPQRLFPELARDTHRMLLLSVWFSAFSALLMLAIQAGLMGDGWGDTWRLGVWWAVLGTTFGEAWRWHLGVCFLTLLALFIPTAKRINLLALCSALLLINMAFIGHAAMHGGIVGILHRFNHSLHLLSAGYWFGSLLPLLVCLRYLTRPQWRDDAVTTLIRFSWWGHVAVALVIITGIINNLIILGHWPLNIDSVYQRLLLIKILLVVLMVLVAIINRYFIVPAMRAKPKLAQCGLVAACWIELGLGAVVLFMVSLFATYSPV